MPISQKHQADIAEMGDDLKRANSAIEIRRYDLAIEILQRVLSTQPENSVALFTLARAYVFKKKPVQAMDLLKETLRLDATYSQAHMLYAALLKDAKQYKQAEEEIRTTIELEPTNHHAHFIYADLLLIFKSFNYARGAIEKALELDPSDAKYHDLLARILAAEGKLDLAEPVYRHALSLEPENARIHNSYGAFLYNQRRNFREAFGHFRIAMMDDPNNPEFRRNFMLALKAKHRWYAMFFGSPNMMGRKDQMYNIGMSVAFLIYLFIQWMWAEVGYPAMPLTGILFGGIDTLCVVYVIVYIIRNPLFNALVKRGWIR